MPVFADQSLLFDLAEALEVPNERIQVTKILDDLVWFSLDSGASFTAKTKNNGTRLRVNSVRRD